MKGKIQTVLGLIEPEQMGFTLTHEHLLHDLPKKVFKQPASPLQIKMGLKDEVLNIENLKWVRQYPYCFEDNIEFSDETTRNAVKEEMHLLKECSTKVTVVENGSIGLRAKDQAIFLKTLSTDTGVNIVTGTGFYVADAQSTSTLSLTQEEMESMMIDDILNGIEGTEVKCGVIGEIGCSWPILPFEKRSLRASAVVQHEIGCPVIIHPGRNQNAPQEIIRIFQEAGGKAEKTVMSHLERTILSDVDLAEFAALGSYCEFDLFGIEVSHYQLCEDVDMPSDAQRIARLHYLVQQGYGNKLVVAHDIHTKHRLGKFGGHGYSHLFQNVMPKMLKRGFTEEDVKNMFYINPANWLMFD